MNRRVFLGLGLPVIAGCALPERVAQPWGTPPQPGPTSALRPPSASSTNSSAASSTSPTRKATPRPAGKASIVKKFAKVRPTQFGTDVDGMLRRTKSGVALTFDAASAWDGTGYDSALVAVLRKNEVPATIFTNARWINANKAAAKKLARSDLFEWAALGAAERPLSVNGRQALGINGTADVAAVYDEIVASVRAIEKLTGTRPRFVRAGTAHADDVAVDIAKALLLRVVSFSIDADQRGTLGDLTIRQNLAKIGRRSIVMARMSRPGSGIAPALTATLPTLLKRDELRFRTLSDALG